jgi:hypothetical protein
LPAGNYAPDVGVSTTSRLQAQKQTNMNECIRTAFEGRPQHNTVLTGRLCRELRCAMCEADMSHTHNYLLVDFNVATVIFGVA